MAWIFLDTNKAPTSPTELTIRSNGLISHVRWSKLVREGMKQNALFLAAWMLNVALKFN